MCVFLLCCFQSGPYSRSSWGFPRCDTECCTWLSIHQRHSDPGSELLKWSQLPAGRSGTTGTGHWTWKARRTYNNTHIHTYNNTTTTFIYLATIYLLSGRDKKSIREYPKPWLLRRAFSGIQEEYQPPYWSWLEQLIWSEVTDPASKPRALW